jgi:dUTP pyrophosphatase
MSLKKITAIAKKLGIAGYKEFSQDKLEEQIIYTAIIDIDTVNSKLTAKQADVVETMLGDALIAFCQEDDIEISEEDTIQSLIEKIKAFLNEHQDYEMDDAISSAIDDLIEIERKNEDSDDDEDSDDNDDDKEVFEDIDPDVINVGFLPNFTSEKKFEVAYKGDAGFDLRNHIGKTLRLRPGKVYAIPTGIVMAVPEGYAGIVMEKSGLGLRNGVMIHGRVIDSNYRGEVIVIVSIKQGKVVLAQGDKIAQVVVKKVMTDVNLVDIDALIEADTARGDKGFGSSGKK